MHLISQSIFSQYVLFKYIFFQYSLLSQKQLIENVVENDYYRFLCYYRNVSDNIANNNMILLISHY